MAHGSVVVVGGTQGQGRELAQSYADEGRDVVVTGRDQSRAETAAKAIGGSARGIGFDLAEPHSIAAALADVGDVDYLSLAAIERGDSGTLRAEEAAERLADAAGGAGDRYRLACELLAHTVSRMASPIQARLARRRWPQL